MHIECFRTAPQSLGQLATKSFCAVSHRYLLRRQLCLLFRSTEITESISSFKAELVDMRDKIARLEDDYRTTLLDKERMIAKVVALTCEDISSTVAREAR